MKRNVLMVDDMLQAGFETVAYTLGWFFAFMCKHQSVLLMIN